jgi:hypothetical protein
MDIQAARCPLELVEKASGQKCHGFTLKKRLKGRTIPRSGTASPFADAVRSAAERLKTVLPEED